MAKRRVTCVSDYLRKIPVKSLTVKERLELREREILAERKVKKGARRSEVARLRAEVDKLDTRCAMAMNYALKLERKISAWDRYVERFPKYKTYVLLDIQKIVDSIVEARKKHGRAHWEKERFDER